MHSKKLFAGCLALGLAASSMVLANSPGTSGTSNFRLWDAQVQPMPTGDDLSELEFAPIIGFEIAGTRRMAFQVLETGCTEREHFALYVDRDTVPARVGLERSVVDNCDKEPRIAFVIASFDQLDLPANGTLNLLNPLVLQEPNTRPVTQGMPAVAPASE